MQQYLTLEEAAVVLEISVDELREMAKKKAIRAFQDRGSWRFRLQDVEEMARQRGLGSDPEVRLGEGKKRAASRDEDEVPIGKEKPTGQGSRGGKTPPPGNSGSDSDVRLVMDEEAHPDAGTGRSGARPGPKSSGRRTRADASDSGVRLVGGDDPNDSDVKSRSSGKDSGLGQKPKSPSDSDIRLQDLPSAGGKKRGDDPSVITEEIDLDAEEARLAEKTRKKGGKGRPSTMMANPSALPTESPFEISEPDLDVDKPSRPTGHKKKSEVDSSSDFELIAFDASKSPGGPGGAQESDDDVNLGNEVAGGRAGNSGINLKDPVDSGISLESGGSDEIAFDLSHESGMTPKPTSGKGQPKDDSSSEFELSLDDSSSEFELSVEDSDEAGSSEFELSLEGSDESGELTAGQPKSDSEFELTLDDDGGLAADEEGKDIFEETNFDVPALEDDSGSEAVAMESDTDLEGSDFEISLDEEGSDAGAGSEVVSLDEDEEADVGAATVARTRKPTRKGKSAAATLDDDEQDLDVDLESSGPARKKKKAAVDEEGEADADSDEELDRPARVAAPAEWGVLPAVFLFPSVMVLFVVGLMSFELVRGMWGYHRPSPVGRPLIDAVARQVDDKLPK